MGEWYWYCDSCGKEANYKANEIYYCDLHWEEYLNGMSEPSLSSVSVQPSVTVDEGDIHA